MTWRLAPLDTHGFHPFKIALQQECQRRRAGHLHGIIDAVGFVAGVRAAVVTVLHCVNWGGAFEHNGYGSRQALIHLTTLKDLRLTATIILPAGCPSDDELSLCVPSNKAKTMTLLRTLFIAEPRVEGETARPTDTDDGVVDFKICATPRFTL